MFIELEVSFRRSLPERLVAALVHADARSPENAAAEHIVELFLNENANGESIMDSLQRRMIVDEVTRRDRAMTWPGKLGRRTIPNHA